MPSGPSRPRPWYTSCLGAIALAGCLGGASCVAFGVWAFWPVAGVEDFPAVRSNAEPLINAIDQYTDARGRPPDKIEQLIPKYISSIPQPIQGSDCNYWYFPRAEGTWEIVVFAGGRLDLDSDREFRFDSRTRTWLFDPD